MLTFRTYLKFIFNHLLLCIQGEKAGELHLQQRYLKENEIHPKFEGLPLSNNHSKFCANFHF